MSLLEPTISASTLSVVQHSSDSITCGVYLDEEYCNLTLRLDDEKARLCGYPHGWKLWNELIDGAEGQIYEDAETDGSIESFEDEIEAMDAYVSRITEKEIFAQLKKSIEKQFDDEMFKDRLTQKEKEEVLAKVDLAIQSL